MMLHRARWAQLSIFAALAVFASACGSSHDKTLSDAELMQKVRGDKVGEVIEKFKGEKAVLVNVWATFCGPCVKEFPHIVELRNKYQDDLEVVFISAEFPEQEPHALKFLRKNEVDWPTYILEGLDEELINSLSQEWTGAMPFTIIFDKNGVMSSQWEDEADYDTFEAYIKQAINKL